MELTKFRKYSNERDYEAFSVVRLNNQVVSGLGGRSSWVHISNPEAGASILRMARGSPPSASLPKEGIELDYEGNLALAIKGAKDAQGFIPCKLVVRQASWHERLIAHWSHPDPAYRFPIQLSLVSFSLGLIGLALGIISLK